MTEKVKIAGFTVKPARPGESMGMGIAFLVLLNVVVCNKTVINFRPHSETPALSLCSVNARKDVAISQIEMAGGVSGHGYTETPTINVVCNRSQVKPLN